MTDDNRDEPRRDPDPEKEGGPHVPGRENEPSVPGGAGEPPPPPPQDLSNLHNVFNRSAQQKAEDRKRERNANAKTLAEAVLVPRFAIMGVNFFDLVSLRLLTREEFEAHPFVVREFGYRSEGLPSPATLLLREPNAVHVDGMTVAPGGPRLVHEVDDHGIPIKCVNLYRPSAIPVAPPGSAPPQEALDHVRWMCPLDGPELLKRFAWDVQNPGKYRPIITLLHGEGRIGKDLLLSLFERVVGPHNMRTVWMSQLTSSFDDYLTASYVKLPELTLGGAKGAEMWDRLKGWTGSGHMRVTINTKYKPDMPAWVQPRFYATSNADDALAHVPEYDKRLFVVGCPANPTSRSSSYFTDLAEVFEDPDFVARFHRYLLDLDLTSYDAMTAPSTNAKTELVRYTMSHFTEQAYDLLTTGSLGRRDVILSDEIEENLGYRDTPENRSAVGVGIKRAGWRRVGRVQSIPTRPYVYVRLTRVTEFARMSAAELMEAAEDDKAITAALE